MGKIPLQDRSIQGIPIVQQGAGSGYNKEAINAHAQGDQAIAKGLSDLGSGLQSYGRMQQAEERKNKNLQINSDLSKFEQEYESARNIRDEAASRTKNVDDLKKINKTYYSSVEHLVHGDVKDTDGIPLFRSQEAKTAGLNWWRKNQGDIKRSHNAERRQIEDAANSTRILGGIESKIRSVDNEDTEKYYKKLIIDDINLLQENGLISAPEKTEMIKAKTIQLRDRMLTNKLANLDTNLKGSIVFEKHFNMYKESVRARSDMTDQEKNIAIDMGDKILQEKKNYENAEINEKKREEVSKWRKNSFKILGDMKPDGSLPITTADLTSMAQTGDLSPEFTSRIIQNRASNKAKLDINKAKGDKAQKIQDSYLADWDDINAYNPDEDPQKVKLAEIHQKINKYSGNLATSLKGALQNKISESEPGLTPDQKGNISSNANYVKNTEDSIKTLLGIGIKVSDGKTTYMKPTASGKFWGTSSDKFNMDIPDGVNEAAYRYDQRVKVFNNILADINTKAKTSNLTELQNYVDEHPTIKSLKQENARKDFFAEYVPSTFKATKTTEAVKDEWVRVKNKKTGEIKLIKRNNYK